MTADFIIGVLAGTVGTVLALAAAEAPRYAFTTEHGVRVYFAGLRPWYTPAEVHQTLLFTGTLLVDAGVSDVGSVARALVGLRVTFLSASMRDKQGSPTYGRIDTRRRRELRVWAPPPLLLGQTELPLLFSSLVAVAMGLPLETPTRDERWARALGLGV